ncbi:helix-turn-helix domain-containing protein [Halosegnis sp.]|uniref:helix-turn-helix domain-containing protein n=1 Tax=Halosegnis sp. TaxID=2864959 RepID=UPI0035D50986
MTTLDRLSSRTAKLVYLYLTERGAATADELSSALDERQLTLLPILETLESEGLVQKDGGRYRPA